MQHFNDIEDVKPRYSETGSLESMADSLVVEAILVVKVQNVFDNFEELHDSRSMSLLSVSREGFIASRDSIRFSKGP